MQVRLCRAKTTGEIFAMKKLKKSEMLSRGQVTHPNNRHFQNSSAFVDFIIFFITSFVFPFVLSGFIIGLII